MLGRVPAAARRLRPALTRPAPRWPPESVGAGSVPTIDHRPALAARGRI